MSNSTLGMVTTDWLADHLDDDHVAVLDASWYLPDMGRDPLQEYDLGHVPGAVFINLDMISAPDTDLPHMMPTAEHFSKCLENLGIGSDHFIVCYDGAGLFSAARLWWMLRAMGHAKAAVLNGGFPKWQREGRPVSTDVPKRTPTTFNAALNTDMVADADDVVDLLSSDDNQIADARGAPRFFAREPEPRPGIRGGHIPGSKNVPYKSLLSESGEMLPNDELKEVFRKAGLNPDAPITATCGSGVTAAIIRLALLEIGAPEAKLYDGSWADWGMRTDLPVAT